MLGATGAPCVIPQGHNLGSGVRGCTHHPAPCSHRGCRQQQGPGPAQDRDQGSWRALHPEGAPAQVKQGRGKGSPSIFMLLQEIRGYNLRGKSLPSRANHSTQSMHDPLAAKGMHCLQWSTWDTMVMSYQL